MFFPEKDLERIIKILVVDDDPGIRDSIYEILLAEGYQVETAENGKEALEKVSSFEPDIVLTDYLMPEMDGINLCRFIKNNPDLMDTGVILITGVNDLDTRVKGLLAGADDFLAKPFMLPELQARIKSLSKVKLYHDFLKDYQKRLEEEVEKKTADLLRANLDLKLAFEEIKELSLETIYRLAKAAEYRDEHTGYHIQRIAHYSVAIGAHLGLENEALDVLRYASPLHDIGKLGIPDAILLKPGALTPSEWEIMKMHSIIGAEILAGSKIRYLKAAEKIARYHHEKWDGTGYPEGLKGERIPLLARITAIADVFDALTTDRPYRKAMTINEAFEIIKRGKGAHFDPQLVEIFFKIKDEILSIRELFRDEEEIPHLFKLTQKIRT
ncbi:chemotaxis protein CheY [Caldimicrobium thiodismutans]|uniref:Chemotaxis protein CheY n=1 Tax=Caldimicrobium thiodismutans TaxID=1653476 RepID=A0A0U5AXN1_9BACT|nr:two-component system response regulator [Caldimicrobium thiodismutans]BAU23406.1 chemotaxis protein CheY [Caldimicrobium thiodismutans]